MPDHPSDLFQRFNVERGDWRPRTAASAAGPPLGATSGKVHWVGSQAQMLRGGQGECFLLTMQFVDYILRKRRKFLRTRTQPYGPAHTHGRLFTLSRNNEARAKFKGVLRPMRTTSSGPDDWQRDYATGMTKAELKAESEKARWQRLNLSVDNTTPDDDDPADISGPAQDAFERRYMQAHRYVLQRVVAPPAGDIRALEAAVREVLSSAPMIAMVHVKPPSPHQMVIVAAIEDSSEFEFFDPNGGYCSFGQVNGAADWFANGLIQQTEYADCRIELHVYTLST